MQLGQLQEIESRLKDLGYQIVAVSPDQPEKLKQSVEKQKLSYSLVSDSKMNAAKSFGIAYHVDNPTFDQLKQYKIDIEESSGEKHHLLPVPAVFLIDKEGMIQFHYVNPDYKIRLKPEVLLAAAESYRE